MALGVLLEDLAHSPEEGRKAGRVLRARPAAVPPGLALAREVEDRGLADAGLRPRHHGQDVVEVMLEVPPPIEEVDSVGAVEVDVEGGLVSVKALRDLHQVLQGLRSAVRPPAVQVYEQDAAVERGDLGMPPDAPAAQRLHDARLLHVEVQRAEGLEEPGQGREALPAPLGHGRDGVPHAHAVERRDVGPDDDVVVEPQDPGHLWQVVVQVEPGEGLRLHQPLAEGVALPRPGVEVGDVEPWPQLVQRDSWDRGERG
mmetsp:Transcript_74169/g.239865  ORF Transcript_74169/g.239865 Transcript_74169/m.239865 type:complete len:257 (-) Transcript_74169:464-1234(-)